MKVICVSTSEIDDPNLAVAIILEQLDTSQFLKNSVGILSCNFEYINNGTVSLLGDALPFDFIGGTTTITSLHGEMGEDILGIMILTSNDAEFATGVTESLKANYEEKLAAMYAATQEKLSSLPSMGIFIGPFMLSLSSDTQVAALEKASNGLLLFGGIALDYNDHVENPRTIHNGRAYIDALPLLLISGDLTPAFFLESISENRFVKQNAIITRSERNILQEVNNVPAMDYIESLGIAENGIIDAIPSIPLSIDTGDGGRPVARAILGMTPEGDVVCGGEMPESAALGVGSFDSDDVQLTVTRMAHEIHNTPHHHGAFIISCFSRNLALGLDTLGETKKIQAILGDKIPYLLFYAGGEVYPEVNDGKIFCKAHNDSIIACVF